MIKTLPGEPYQLESEHVEGAKLRVNILLNIERAKRSKLNFNVIERKLKDKNQMISQVYTDDKNRKYSSNLRNILKSGKNLNEKLYTKKKPPKLPLLNF